MNERSFYRVSLLSMSKREQILEAGIRLFVERGLQGTSMSLLAKEANVATGSVYNYFESKEQLINEIFLYVKKREAEFLLEHYHSQDSYEQRFKELYRSIIQFMLDNCLYFRFSHLYGLSPVIEDKTREQLLHVFEPFIKLYQEAYNQGVIRVNTIPDTHIQIYGGFSYFMHWQYLNNQSIDESLVEQMVEFAWAAIKNWNH
jgi:AcrR family transcriptional regulator